jgi:alpha-tubulin suppressor-like RCC1 family protein
MRSASVAVVLLLVGCGAQAEKSRDAPQDEREPLPPLVDTMPARGPAPRSISIGLYHSAAIDAQGRAFCWGRGLGWNPQHLEEAVRPTPCGPVGETFVAISAGERNTCAIRTDGVVRCWGSGPSIKPTDEQSGKATAIAVGEDIACALLEGGSVSCSQNSPPKIMNPDSPATHIAVNGRLACARLVSGGVSCWGNDHDHGVIEGAAKVTDARSIAVGYNHACALVTDGVACWGANYYGQIGNGAKGGLDERAPVRVGDGALVDPIAVSAGANDTCAITSAGGVFCWGWNVEGQIGDGTVGTIVQKEPGGPAPTTEDRHAPTSVQGLSRGATNLVMGGYTGMAVLSTGTVVAWGMNHIGQIGDGTKQDRHTPVAVLFE